MMGKSKVCRRGHRENALHGAFSVTSVTSVAILFFVFFGSHARAQSDYPTKPVRVVVGLGPGGGTDIQARLFAQKLTEYLGRSFVVDNRTGAGGTVAYHYVAKSPPDGYTLLAVASGYSITPAVYAKLPYDPIKDFAPISLAVEAPMLLLTHPSLPAKSIKDLLALMRAKPGALDFGSAGYGSSTHMALALFTSLSKLNVTHVPYKGTGQALTDGVAGQVHGLFANILSCLPYVRAKRLNALAVSSAKRSVVLPDLPTVAEGGVAGYVTTTWHGWLAPAGTPAPIIGKLHAELTRAARAPDVAERLATDGGEAVGGSPEVFTRHIAAEIARWRKVVRDANIKVE
jgi:tripartite-type tricarboxylate transporter receptor subunit TctC